jgi:hypothetical protein
MPNGGSLSGTQNTWEAVLQPAAAKLGGKTLSDMPGEINALAPAIAGADRIVFFTASAFGPLTQAEMDMIQASPDLMERTIFVFGAIH